ncbi:MAG: permease-like cell division protein FtsX [Erysipelotrichaceae bacterium]
MIRFIKFIPYHMKTAFKNVYRHLAMSLSASSAVCVTLILIMLFVVVAGNIAGFTRNIEDGVQIHVTVDATLTENEVQEVGTSIRSIQNIGKVSFSSKEDELELFIESFGESGEMFAIYRGESNPMRDAYIIDVNDKFYIDEVTAKILAIDGVESAEYGGSSTMQMIESFNSIRIGGFIFVAALSMLAIFLISNTIKITIHARANEIAIMRNVGATNNFIRMPFMFEGMIIGLLGSIIPVATLIIGYHYFYESLNGMLFSNMFVLQPVFPFVIDITYLMIAVGIGVGLLGSLFSVGKYLRWKR